jgi:hypothetical protein
MRRVEASVLVASPFERAFTAHDDIAATREST